ncbi:hypothetical protein JHK82_023071 [Glycine max]|nr:hypothetical protein JHK85_023591 [Glycine max]KAG5027207.1 hypothetical protein JHK86_023121 [Glycine max]KAG5138340.1 hypothetical protein JHK82_023071 [Glycine max]
MAWKQLAKFIDVDNLFGDVRVDIKDKGQSMTLTMDEYSGSGIVSKNEYLFGRFDLKIKLVEETL